MNLGIPNVKYCPWVGNVYAKGYRGRKLLILGESVYEKGQTDSDVSSTLILGERFPFYNKIYNTVADPMVETKEAFWSSVAFYNYVQESVGNRPRLRPTPAMWDRSRQPFLDVVEKLSPDCILVLGYALWNNLERLELIDRDPVVDRSYLRGVDRRIRIGRIKHPSAYAFHAGDWKRIISELLNGDIN